MIIRIINSLVKTAVTRQTNSRVGRGGRVGREEEIGHIQSESVED